MVAQNVITMPLDFYDGETMRRMVQDIETRLDSLKSAVEELDMPEYLKQLGQSQPANAGVNSLYSPANDVEAEILELQVVNSSAGAVTFNAFLDQDGATYDASTQVLKDESVPANSSVTFKLQWGLDDPNGNLAVQAATASTLTFTAHGRQRLKRR